MTTWYVSSGVRGNASTGADESDGTAGNDTTGNGSATLPYLTLSKLQAVIQNGDTAYLAGRFRVANASTTIFTKSNANTMSFFQWPGKTQADIRGDNIVTGAGAGWTDNGDGSFSLTVANSGGTLAAGLGATLATCTYGWDEAGSLDSAGRRISHLKRAADKVTAQANAGQYFYDNATGELTIHAPLGEDPVSQIIGNGVTISVRGRNAFYFDDSGANVVHHIVVSGIRFALWADATSAKGYGVLIVGGADCSISNCTFEDMGFHGVGWPGGRCLRNRTYSNTFRGLASGGFGIAFYANSGSVTDCTSTNDLFYCNSLLDFGGLPVSTGYVGGIIGHGSLAVRGVRVTNARFIEYTPASGAPDQCTCVYNGMTSGFTPTDKLNPETYPLIVEQTDPTILTVSNGSQLLGQCSAAFVGCRIQMGQSGTALANVAWTQKAVFGDNAGGPAGTKLGYFGCELVADLGIATPAACSMFICNANAEIVLVNTSVYDKGTVVAAGGAANQAMCTFANAAAVYTCYQSIFAFRATAAAGNKERRLCTGAAENVIAADHHIFLDCVYWNVTAGKYSQNAAFATDVLFTGAVGVIDINGLILTENPFMDLIGADLRLKTFGTMYLARKEITTHASRGCDGYDYAGRYGGRQRTTELMRASANRELLTVN